MPEFQTPSSCLCICWRECYFAMPPERSYRCSCTLCVIFDVTWFKIILSLCKSNGQLLHETHHIIRIHDIFPIKRDRQSGGNRNLRAGQWLHVVLIEIRRGHAAPLYIHVVLARFDTLKFFYYLRGWDIFIALVWVWMSIWLIFATIFSWLVFWNEL